LEELSQRPSDLELEKAFIELQDKPTRHILVFILNEDTNQSQDFDFCEAFLRNVDGEYVYLIKGKNGEPKRGVLVDFTFHHQYYYSTRS
jgi:hypothetical protein